MLKRWYRTNFHAEPGVAHGLGFGVLSAFIGQLVSFPLEAVSRRMQLGTVAVASGTAVAAGGMREAAVAGGAGSSMSALAVLSGILKEGGPTALYRCGMR